MTEMLIELKQHYNSEETNLVYVTLVQNGMDSSLNSGAYNLQQEEPKNILHFIMNMFNRYVNSNENIELNSGFQIFYKVLSYNHVMWPKHRRKTGPFRNLGCQSSRNSIKISGCVDISAGFPGNELAFLNRCVLTSILLSFFANEHYRNPSQENIHFQLQPLYQNHSSIKKKIAAGKLLLEIISTLTEELNLPTSGPYDLIEVAPKLCEYLNCQIHLVKSNQANHSIIHSFPDSEWKDELQQIFLFSIEEDHVLPVINPKAFFNKNRQVCLICKHTFRGYYRHYCQVKEKSCTLCCSFYAKENTLIHKNLPFSFCFNKLDQPLEEPLKCRLCNYTFQFLRCFQNHQKICGINPKSSKIGKFCDTCKKFIKKQNVRNHVCPASNQQECKFCRETFDKIKPHFCQLVKEELTKVWPKLIFYDFEFENISKFNCLSCSKLRNKFQIANNLSLKMAIRKPEYFEIKCDHHKKFENYQNPNFCTLWKEDDLGHFDQIAFANDALNCDLPVMKNIHYFNYNATNTNPNQIPPKYSNQQILIGTTNFQLAQNKAKETKNVKDYLLDFIFEHCKGYTFISLNHNSKNMGVIMEMFLASNMQPEVVKKSNQFISIAYNLNQNLFLNASNYVKGDYEEIVCQFNLDIPRQYFPSKLNCLDYHNYDGKIPSIEDFLNVLDSDEITAQKQDYVSSRKNNWWHFKTELQKISAYKTSVVARACLSYLQETLEFQENFKSAMHINEDFILHPFTARVPTAAAYSYKMFRNYCLNHEDIYAVSNGSLNMKNSSRGELEFVSFMEVQFPEKQFQHNFSSAR